MEFEIKAKFEIEQADSHRLPAYEGAQSIQGIARGLVLATHFAATGVVRHRMPFDSDLQVYIEPPRRGSLEAIFQVIGDPESALIGAFGVGITVNFVYDAIKTVFSRAVGKKAAPTNSSMRDIDSDRSGDVDALVDAVEPSLRLGHKAIGSGANNIIIIQGDNNVVNFDDSTKEYVERSYYAPTSETQNLSIGSFNANSGYGRAYFHDLGKTIPFIIDKDAAPTTREAISYSLFRYANSYPSDIAVNFQRVNAADGRTKRIIIHGAEKLSDE